jgi:hypothetical protein
VVIENGVPVDVREEKIAAESRIRAEICRYDLDVTPLIGPGLKRAGGGDGSAG